MEFDFKNIDLSNQEICSLCSKENHNCLCNDEYYCPCNIKAKNCKWPDVSCFCYKCIELINDCKCKLKEE
jgi:hypothetical protein